MTSLTGALFALYLSVVLHDCKAYHRDAAISPDVPDACRYYACPPYTVIEKGVGYEYREYAPSVWVKAADQPRNEWYRDLLNYMNGENESGLKLKRTLPIGKSYQFTPENYMMGESNAMVFYTNMTNPPEPTNNKLHLVRFPTVRGYARSYGFWTNSLTAQWHANALLQAIDSGNVLDPNHVFVDVYSSPWAIFGRHNEVAFMARHGSAPN